MSYNNFEIKLEHIGSTTMFVVRRVQRINKRMVTRPLQAGFVRMRDAERYCRDNVQGGTYTVIHPNDE